MQYDWHAMSPRRRCLPGRSPKMLDSFWPGQAPRTQRRLWGPQKASFLRSTTFVIANYLPDPCSPAHQRARAVNVPQVASVPSAEAAEYSPLAWVNPQEVYRPVPQLSGEPFCPLCSGLDWPFLSPGFAHALTSALFDSRGKY